MNYELAKELKDAGFPQKGYNFGSDGNTRGYVDTDGSDVYEPSLEELIEACGVEFEHLDQRFPGWRASGGISADARPSHYGEGSTPSEAVARLWLALKKKV